MYLAESAHIDFLVKNPYATLDDFVNFLSLHNSKYRSKGGTAQFYEDVRLNIALGKEIKKHIDYQDSKIKFIQYLLDTEADITYLGMIPKCPFYLFRSQVKRILLKEGLMVPYVDYALDMRTQINYRPFPEAFTGYVPENITQTSIIGLRGLFCRGILSASEISNILEMDRYPLTEEKPKK